jgi:hypothetical protein
MRFNIVLRLNQSKQGRGVKPLLFKLNYRMKYFGAGR